MKDKIEKSQRNTQHQLLRSTRGVDKTARRARQIEVAALAMQKKLARALPDLKRAVEASQSDPNVSDDERAAREREYLGAQSDFRRCDRTFQLARRQRIIAANL